MNQHPTTFTTAKPSLAAVPASQWRDSLTGCIRRDIQSKWLAEIVVDGEVRRTSTPFYLDADADESAAKVRARLIWSPARDSRCLVVTKLRDATAVLVDDAALQSFADSESGRSHPLREMVL